MTQVPARDAVLLATERCWRTTEDIATEQRLPTHLVESLLGALQAEGLVEGVGFAGAMFWRARWNVTG